MSRARSTAWGPLCCAASTARRALARRALLQSLAKLIRRQGSRLQERFLRDIARRHERRRKPLLGGSHRAEAQERKRVLKIGLRLKIRDGKRVFARVAHAEIRAVQRRAHAHRVCRIVGKRFIKPAERFRKRSRKGFIIRLAHHARSAAGSNARPASRAGRASPPPRRAACRVPSGCAHPLHQEKLRQRRAPAKLRTSA